MMTLWRRRRMRVAFESAEKVGEWRVRAVLNFVMSPIRTAEGGREEVRMGWGVREGRETDLGRSRGREQGPP